VTFEDRSAGFTVWIGVDGGLFGGIKGHCEEAGGRRFPRSTGADKQECVGDSIEANRIFKGLNDRFLADKFTESLGPTSPCYYLIILSHEQKLSIKDLRHKFYLNQFLEDGFGDPDWNGTADIFGSFWRFY
jgi:hypothetical protein